MLKPRLINSLITNLKQINGAFFKDDQDLTKRLAQKVNLLLSNLETYKSSGQYPIRIGIKGHDTSKLINVLLADPLSEGQKWYKEIKLRDTGVNNLFVYGDTARHVSNVPTNRDLSLWRVNTPLLDKDKRKANFQNLKAVYGSKNETFQLNDLQLLEIITPKVGNCYVQDIIDHDDDEFYEFYDHGNLGNLHYGDGCHMYLYLTKQELDLPVDEEFPYLHVVETSNPDKTKLSIDLETAQNGNEALMENLSETNKYIKCLNHSNVLRLVYTLNVETLGHENMVQLLKTFNRLISEKYFNLANNQVILDQQNNQITQEIDQWAQAANDDLQHLFLPKVTKYQDINLPWWKLIYVCDDIEFLLLNILSDTANTRFSLEYIQGKIDTIGKEDRVLVPNVSILDTLKPSIVDIQNKAARLISQYIVGLQIPVAVVSYLGYAIYGFDGYTMVGLFLFASALAVNRALKKWDKVLLAFNTKVKETIRISINNSRIRLQEHWNTVYGDNKLFMKKNQLLVQELRNNIVLLEANAARQEK